MNAATNELPRFYFRAAADEPAYQAAKVALREAHEAARIEVAAAEANLRDAWATPNGGGRATKVQDATRRVASAKRAELLARGAEIGGPL